MSQSTSLSPTDATHPLLGIPMDRLPRHVAIIMDGNGRWAQERGLPRIEGHRNGSKGVREVLTAGATFGLQCLTLYSFSTENWKRPPAEISALMDLYHHYLIAERPTIVKHNIRVRHLGRKEGLPDHVLDELDETVRLSAGNTGMTLCLALNYSGRTEIALGIKRICQSVQNGELNIDDINEQCISDHLDTVGLPDPDLLIRTSGEMRISNFLLWQISYAELFVTDVHWPDFNTEIMADAIRVYAGRDRRFGGLHIR